MEEKILQICLDVCPNVDFENETALIDDEILESFDIITIVTNLMDEFDIFIDADDIEPEYLNTFEGICEMVRSKLEA
ncbi:MAG: acyl carrier protein [Lachnospiraceae bacterium]|nr:acyl carrier protein [Lachnospiraceae bacterium]